MRGKALEIRRLSWSIGITPAYAGKSYILHEETAPDGDHPRLCGEKSIGADKRSFQQGSPPPMRGKASRQEGKRRLYRITPAYAGKRKDIAADVAFSEDHPRLCGEKVWIKIIYLLHKGSPPPMRGKAKYLTNTVKSCRITPAYAGKRYTMQVWVSTVQDHPRLCGEKTKKIPKQRYFFHQPASFSFSLQYT